MLLQLFAALLMPLGWAAVALTQKRPLARLTDNNVASLGKRVTYALRATGTTLISIASMILIAVEGPGFGSLMAIIVATFAVCVITMSITLRWLPLRQAATVLISKSGA